MNLLTRQILQLGIDLIGCEAVCFQFLFDDFSFKSQLKTFARALKPYAASRGFPVM